MYDAFRTVPLTTWTGLIILCMSPIMMLPEVSWLVRGTAVPSMTLLVDETELAPLDNMVSGTGTPERAKLTTVVALLIAVYTACTKNHGRRR